MGECSFGKGFGQTNPSAEPEEGIAEKIWRSIPVSIFDNLAAKYQVRDSYQLDACSRLTSSRMSLLKELYGNLASMSSLTGLPKWCS